MPALYPGSVFSDVVQAVATQVAASIAAAFPLPSMKDGVFAPVFRRKKPILLEGDPVPCIVVSPAPEGPRIVREWFGRGVVYGYPVVVVLFFPGNAIYTAIEDRFDTTADVAEREYADIMRVQEAVRQIVFQPVLPGVASVYDVEIVPSPAIEATGQNSKLYAVAGLVATYHSSELRAA